MVKKAAPYLHALSSGLMISWILLGPLCWVFRDGLGPESSTSTGWLAVQRLLFTFYWGPTTLFLILCTFLFGRWRKRAWTDDSSQPPP